MCYNSKEICKVSSCLSPVRSYTTKYLECSTNLCDPCTYSTVCNFSPSKCVLPTKCYSPGCSPCRIRTSSPISLSTRYCSPCRLSFSPNVVTCTNIVTCDSPCIINCNAYEEGQFNDFLRKLMNAESQIENAKINLALNPDFNCEDAFRIFELNCRGFLDQCDLKCGLNLIGVFPTDHEVRLLMKRFDLQKTGTLNYADFFDMLAPFDKGYRTMVENRCPNSCCTSRCPEVFCFNTLCCLKNLFNLIINCENDINNNRKLFGTLRLKLRDIFGLIDCIRKGYFTNSELNCYLRNKCLFSTDKDADLLFIRLDKCRNGRVSYLDVEEEIQTLY